MSSERPEDAAALLLAIERRALSLRARLRLAVAALLSSDDAAAPDPAAEQPTIEDLERFAPQWSNLVPADPVSQARITFQLASKYRLTSASTARLRTALHWDSPDVGAAFQKQNGRPLESIFAATGPGGALDDAFEHDLESELEWVVLPGGETLFRQGDVGDSLYILVSGRLAVSLARPGEDERVVAEASPGETVGEMALLTGEARSATVRALRDAELVRLSKTGFNRLLEKHPRALTQIATLIVMRLKRANVGGRRQVPLTAMAVMAAGTGGGGVTDFCRRLSVALAARGATLHLNSHTVDQEFRPGASQMAAGHGDGDLLSAWLSDMEYRYRYIVYECDERLTPWTRRCLRQADRVLLVAATAAEPEPNESEKELAAAHATIRCELVLLRRDGQEPSPGRTARWLAPRTVALHHHTGETDEAGYARLVRFLTGSAVGLALSGGGARGFVHIGTIRAMRELGVPIDVIAGTSMGSMIGAQCALGWEIQTMLDIGLKGFVGMRPMIDYTVPFVSLLRGGRMMRMLTMMYGDRQIEDLPIKYFCVSANLTTGQTMSHEQGLLRKFLRASSSVPGMFPPVWDRGSLLVDGGLLNNLPADELRRFCDRERIVAVNCNPQAAMASGGEFGDTLSFSQVLWNWINPRKENLRVPNIHAILERTTMLASIQVAREYERGGAGLYLHPPTDEYDLFALKKIEDIAELGYRYAFPRIEAWKKGLGI